MDKELQKKVLALLSALVDLHPGIWQARTEITEEKLIIFLDMCKDWKATSAKGWALGSHVGALVQIRFGKISYGGKHFDDSTFVMYLKWKTPDRTA